jgi:hypothetical protein
VPPKINAFINYICNFFFAIFTICKRSLPVNPKKYIDIKELIKQIMTERTTRIIDDSKKCTNMIGKIIERTATMMILMITSLINIETGKFNCSFINHKRVISTAV